MSEGRSSVSNAQSYREMGEYWDRQDLGESWDRTEPADFDVVDTTPKARYYALDTRLAAEVAEVAQNRGVSAGTLVNLWVREKLQQQPELAATAG